MPQRTVFPALPNTAEPQYLYVLQSLFAELNRRGGDVPFKEFRNWMKERNIWVKEEAEELFAFLGCPVKPNVQLGDFARRFMAAETTEAQQRVLYLWLNAWNPFLTKYVFEALDVDGGGRLHSTHELYRLITSYVYAGKYVTLPAFQNWIKWMAATGYMKYIGIRWGLSDAGKREMGAIRQIDIDELLEDEADEAAADGGEEGGEDADDAPATAKPNPAPPFAAAPPPPASPPVTARAAAPADDGDEEMDDLPPEAPVPTWEPPADHPLADVAAEPPPAAPPSAPAVPPIEPPARAAPKARAAKAAPLPGPASPPRPAARPASPADLEDTANRIRAWYAAFPGRRADRAADLGFAPKQYGGNRELFLMRLLTLSRLAESEVPASVWQPFFRQVDGDRLFDRYYAEGRSLEDICKDAQWFADKPAWRALFGRIVFDLMRTRAALKSNPGLADALEDMPDGPAVAGLLHDKVFHGEVTAAPFWVVREMHALELWENPAYAAVSAVPTATLRGNAYRLGYVDTMYAESHGAMVAASEAVSRWFPPSAGGDLPLHVLHEGYGCAFGCARTFTCDLACREKTSPLSAG